MAAGPQIITREQLSDIPKKTGVYLFHGKFGRSSDDSILYIGKAKSLFSRVRQYFLGDADRRPFVQFIRQQVEKIEYIVVETEQDALLLENELIKKYRPPYNISLKDDRRFLSLRLDLDHEWPQIEVVRRIRKDKAIYLGPFSSSTRLRETLDFMQKIFLLRTCTDSKLYNRSRPCLEYEIKRCVAPCVNYVTKEDYAKIVEGAVMFLKGNTHELVESLKVRMEAAAEAERFEEAAQVRDQIQAINSTTEGQSVIGVKQWQQGNTQDVVGIAEENGFIVIVLLFVRNGIIFDKRSFEFKNLRLDRESLLVEFLDRYYQSGVVLPDEIIVPISIPEGALEIEPKVVVPRAEEKRNFLKIAEENALVHLKSKQQKLERLEKTLGALQQLLTLSKFPNAIDCIDISHHQGAETVASVVRFKEGLPYKDGYRRIKLKEDQVDDFASMRDALHRRYHEVSDLPDLLVIDGGKGQLQAAEEILKERGWLDRVDLISLAKSRDREGIDPLNPQNRERVFKPHQKNPVLLKEGSAEELLMQFIRDEAHRFAITYHRLRKDRSISVSVLNDIEGMTEKVKLKLLRRFGSIDGLREASDDEILEEVNTKMLQRLREKLDEVYDFQGQ